MQSLLELSQRQSGLPAHALVARTTYSAAAPTRSDLSASGTSANAVRPHLILPHQSKACVKVPLHTLPELEEGEILEYLGDTLPRSACGRTSLPSRRDHPALKSRDLNLAHSQAFRKRPRVTISKENGDYRGRVRHRYHPRSLEVPQDHHDRSAQWQDSAPPRYKRPRFN